MSVSSLLASTSQRLCRASVKAVCGPSKRLISAHARAEPTHKTPQELDPALLELLDASNGEALKGLKQKTHHYANQPVELQVLEGTESEVVHGTDLDASHFEPRAERRSPAAVLGSDRPAQIIMSEELESAIASLVEKSDKHQLRSDAKRLFLTPTATSSSTLRWESKMPEMGSKSKQLRLAPRTGLAYATVALPAQYAAITTVLRELKLRVGTENIDVRQVVDFGSKTGAALWASRAEFGDLPHYMGLDTSVGMTAMANDLLEEVGDIPTKTRLLNSWGRTGQKLAVSKDKTIAMCAFTLSDLNTEFDRRQMLREIWSTGAEYLIVIDHGTKEGFQCVGDARDYFLYKGRKEVKLAAEETAASSSVRPPSKVGNHVVAPCPHDGACPLHVLADEHSRRKAEALQRKFGKKATPPTSRAPDLSQTRLGPTTTCHFSQRLQRPAFVRNTKHSYKGHEDVIYSYVIIRQGPRPVSNGPLEQMRIGEVGREAMESQAQKERMLEGGSAVAEEVDDVFHFRGSGSDLVEPLQRPVHTPGEMKALRSESYSWPRVIYPPIKRSGHVILDACTEDGNISRLTIPKSQGKQPYYDARKASWGDIFPHEPKNGREIRKRGKAAGSEVASVVPEVELDDAVVEQEEEEDDLFFKHKLAMFQEEFGIKLPKDFR